MTTDSAALLGSRHRASFRDPCGFIFTQNKQPYRLVTDRGLADYQRLMDSGLYAKLAGQYKLIPHQEVSDQFPELSSGMVIKPDQVAHISYPYEWCFSQLKDAALLTLDICKQAVEHGLILKDASSYNVQFHLGRPVFIDTGSFATYQEGEAWPGYQQFCKHFLAPLVLASRFDIRFLLMLESHIDGIPLEIVSRLLPIRSWLSFGMLSHIHMHARVQRKFSNKPDSKGKARTISKLACSASLIA